VNTSGPDQGFFFHENAQQTGRQKEIFSDKVVFAFKIF
jgi:hypothetical protein